MQGRLAPGEVVLALFFAVLGILWIVAAAACRCGTVRAEFGFMPLILRHAPAGLSPP